MTGALDARPDAAPASSPAPLYLAGRWHRTAATLAIENPATEETVGYVSVAADEEVDLALRAADESWRAWAQTDAWTRCATLRRIGQLLGEREEEIAACMTEEQGKPLAEARGEVNAAAEQFDWYADEARRLYGRLIPGHSTNNRLSVLHQPVGPVAAFTAWNFPALLPARKIAPALAAGCSIILKPAEEAPRTALAIARACSDAGLPGGLLNVVVGDPLQISERLLRSDVVRKVTLTGSVPVGEHLLRLAAAGIKGVTMELGGHAPVLVLADADPKKAAVACARAKFRNCGQVCISPSRFYVADQIASEFLDAFSAAVADFHVGPGDDPATDVGPLANARRLQAVRGLVDDARAQGAEVRIGGRRPPGHARGYFYEPTVLADVTESMRVMHEEPFGPIAPICTFADPDDAIASANSTAYGLASYVFTNNLTDAYRIAEALETGMVGINHMLLATAEAPFGGVKRSGFGREGGSEGIEAYTVTKYINVAL
jgi:succinate-semialdehyde dehydrogenase / glutarate-semialdehyde dehydrogenase